MLARNYVKPALLKITYDVAQNMSRQFPGVTVNYLDANFPFIDKFPLLPHLSHNDGKKLDISFQYDAAVGGEFTNKIPSLIGYGICEEPKAGEENMPQSCGEKGYWQYNLLRMIIPQSTKMNFMFNENRTAACQYLCISRRSQ